jgi:hypothetical protein
VSTYQFIALAAVARSVRRGHCINVRASWLASPALHRGAGNVFPALIVIVTVLLVSSAAVLLCSLLSARHCCLFGRVVFDTRLLQQAGGWPHVRIVNTMKVRARLPPFDPCNPVAVRRSAPLGAHSSRA